LDIAGQPLAVPAGPLAVGVESPAPPGRETGFNLESFPFLSFWFYMAEEMSFVPLIPFFWQRFGENRHEYPPPPFTAVHQSLRGLPPSLFFFFLGLPFSRFLVGRGNSVCVGGLAGPLKQTFPVFYGVFFLYVECMPPGIGLLHVVPFP